MKKLLTFLTTILLLSTIIVTSANAAKVDFCTDYSRLIVKAATENNIKAGEYYVRLRNEKIMKLDLEEVYQPFGFNDFYLVSKLITIEYGCSWLPYEDKIKVGEVLFNRVASPEFPNTFEECIYQENPVQYYTRDNKKFQEIIPMEDCCMAALELFNGTRLLNEPAAVFQSKSKLGSGVFVKLLDPTGYYSPCYIGLSNYPDLYNS